MPGADIYRFAVRDRFKQELLLRALEQLKIENESQWETRAIMEMVSELERIAERRHRGLRIVESG